MQLRTPIIGMALAATALAPSASRSERVRNPLRFFEGSTVTVGTVRVVMTKAYGTRSTGRGLIRRDGSLYLVQRVEDDGRPPHERRWDIRQVGPGRYAGTMSEAKGPVKIEEVGGRFRFQFKMKGGLSAEQWLTPLPDGKSARMKLTVRKLGMTVARSDGIIRKIG
jgi:hypothetical protein